MHRRILRAFVGSLASLGAAIVAFAPAGAVAAEEPLGPPFGTTKYVSQIDDFGIELDEDVFAAPMVVGEKLTATVSAPRTSDLRPELTLVMPDGTILDEAALGVKHDRTGRKATLKGFAATVTGQWGVRVRGLDGTKGAYQLSTRVAKAKPIRLRGQAIDAAGQATLDHVFGGFDGAELNVVLSWPRGQGPVRIDSIVDPDGNEVQNPLGGLAKDAVVPKGTTKLLLRKMPLSVGHGDYRLRTAIDAGAATYSITISVIPRSRANTGRKPVLLDDREPTIAPRTSPLLGIGGSRVRVDGAGFLDGATVFVGGNAGDTVAVDPAGRFIDFDAPEGTEGATVSLAVQNPDGQVGKREAYFQYPLPPTLTDVTDVGGVSVRGGSTLGSQTRRIVGANFTTPLIVRFGTVAATLVGVSPDRTVATVTTSFATASVVKVSVTDAFGRVAISTFDYQVKAPPGFRNPAFSPTFCAVVGGTPATALTTGLEADDKLLIDGAQVPITYVNALSATFSSPAKPAGTYPAVLVDRFGSQSTSVDFVVRGAPTITSITGISGPFAGANEVPLAGGTTLRATGTNFAASYTFTLDGVQLVPTAVAATAFDFVAPEGADYGGVPLTITDSIGQSATLEDAIRYVGFEDSTADRTPGGSSTDNYTAYRGAIGDLDADGREDDLVLGSWSTYYPPGTRYTLTRILFSDDDALVDATDSNFPKAFGDTTGTDPWRADAVAIGDVDGSGGQDVVTAGLIVAGYSYYGYGYYYNDVKLFANDGSGNFTFDYNNSAVYVGEFIKVTDTTYGGTYPLFTSQRPYFGLGLTNALALGDIDGDSDLDVVAATGHYRAGQLLMPTYSVTFTPGYYTSPYAHFYYKYSYYGGYYYYAPGSLVFLNDIANKNGLKDVSFPRLPLAGSYGSFSRAFVGNDIALGDVDRDGDLDMVIAWPDPLTTTPYGLYTSKSYWFYYTSYDYARIASAVMENDGNGFFKDASVSWLPQVAGDEFWQGHRVALSDLDNDADLDMVILHGSSIDAYKGSPSFTTHALRILRNDLTNSSFTDVTSTALPSVPLAGTADDNLRGYALTVEDLNGDGIPDIVVGTDEPLTDSDGNPVHRTRILFGRAGLKFGLGTDFLPPVTSDSGEAGDLLVGDIGGDSQVELVLITQYSPAYSTNYESLRVFDWRR